ncbi:MAG: hypothetical protein Q8P77_03750 [Candidatus Veblenbacteria bacterium]|nr:hypothetical protein [Candidatus Veblenbacteria bacterium]
MAPVQEAGLLGQPMRWYVDQAERPWVGLSLFLLLGFVSSFWLEISYLEVVAPLALVAQLLAAVVAAYLTGVHGGATWGQTLITCLLVGAGGGLVSAVLSFIRFFYPWLLLNLVTEPVWSGLLAAGVGVITIGFFHLPELIRRGQAV